ncbi:alpha/beta fold hydrolase [Halomonas sp. M20]|uniref:alpha/beta fold hydrolase n=1 Tax=Halomonas sp. M20 TaxID=2763264 RepID=UPI001D09BE34|nr:alpha/beta fold hydrolase [Halomonas sp. M20]
MRAHGYKTRFIKYISAGCALTAASLIATSAIAQIKSEHSRLESSGCATRALSDAGAQCYTLYTEENHDHPNGTTIEVPVAVLPSDSQGQERSQKTPAFFFTGGPGASMLAAPELIRQYRKDVGARPLVVFDYRGMNHSQPALKCPDYANVSTYHDIIFSPAISGSLSTTERMRSIADAVQRCYQKLEAEGSDISQYNSYTIAQDVEAIREGLGYDSINVYGRSTGGGTALQYMRYYPEHVRSAVLVSPWYTNLRNRAPIDEFYTAKQKYTDILGLCVRQNEQCQHTVPAWFLAIERARRALDSKPYVKTLKAGTNDEETHYFDGVAFLHTLYITLPSMYEDLPRVVSEVQEGDYGSLDEFFRIDTFKPETEAPSYALGYFLANTCNDMGANRPTKADSRAMLEREPALLGFEQPWVCAWWGTDGAVPKENSQRFESDTPVLSIHGQMDPCCGIRWGQHLAESFENIQVVELQGHGHTPDSECGTTMMQGFLRDPNAPVDDSCKKNNPLEAWKL